MENHDIVFGIGPAGTGKTYLAVAAAVAALKSKHISRIILTRPAVEAGETLGFLPGDIQEESRSLFAPPLYDALARHATRYTIATPYGNAPHLKLHHSHLCEDALWNNAFVILDEAQNTTINQMKMFLTRLGNNAKAV